LDAGPAAGVIEAREPFVGEALNYDASVASRGHESQLQRLRRSVHNFGAFAQSSSGEIELICPACSTPAIIAHLLCYKWQMKNLKWKMENETRRK